MSQVALVTGGSRGIGLGIAKALAAKGYDIAINGIRKESELTETLNDLRFFGTEIQYYPCDIADIKAHKVMIDKIHDELGPINILVNNAGVAPKVRADILEATEESYDFVMNANVKGAYFLSQVVAKNMIENKNIDPHFEAKIINITSISSNTASVNRGDYCVSKAAASMISQLYAVRLAEFNIPVYEIRPGIIKTDMTEGVTEKYDDLISKGLTLQKRWGMPDDIGNVVKSIVSNDFEYATGQIFTIDGGMGISRI